MSMLAFLHENTQCWCIQNVHVCTGRRVLQLARPPVIVEQPLQSIASEVAAWNDSLHLQALPSQHEIKCVLRDGTQVDLTEGLLRMFVGIRHAARLHKEVRALLTACQFWCFAKV